MPPAQDSAGSDELLLEEYKLYVQMTDQVSARRADTNRLYVSLLTALLALLPIIVSQVSAPGFRRMALLSLSVLGLALCCTWLINLVSYRQLNWLKFRVIHEMEHNLPFACYEREWEILKQEGRNHRYYRLAHVERYVPVLFIVLFMALLGYAALATSI